MMKKSRKCTEQPFTWPASDKEREYRELLTQLVDMLPRMAELDLGWPDKWTASALKCCATIKQLLLSNGSPKAIHTAGHELAGLYIEFLPDK